jgi:hypothetical protein
MFNPIPICILHDHALTSQIDVLQFWHWRQALDEGGVHVNHFPISGPLEQQLLNLE